MSKSIVKLMRATVLFGVLLVCAPLAHAQPVYDSGAGAIVFSEPVYARYPEDYLMGTLILEGLVIAGLAAILLLLRVAVGALKKNEVSQMKLKKAAGIVRKAVLVLVVVATLNLIVISVLKLQPRPENRTKRIWLFEKGFQW